MKTVAIIGRGKTCQYAPFDNANIDIWAFNDNAKALPRISAMFEMHPDWADSPRLNSVPGIEEYRKWIQLLHPFPVYMYNADPRIPSAVRYPFEYIANTFRRTLMKGENEVSDFYTSTTPYAIALAIYKGYERIELYGIELTQETEYRDHRDSVFFWLGRATGLGVQVYTHEDSKLYRSARYPCRL